LSFSSQKQQQQTGSSSDKVRKPDKLPTDEEEMLIDEAGGVLVAPKPDQQPNGTTAWQGKCAFSVVFGFFVCLSFILYHSNIFNAFYATDSPINRLSRDSTATRTTGDNDDGFVSSPGQRTTQFVAVVFETTRTTTTTLACVPFPLAAGAFFLVLPLLEACRASFPCQRTTLFVVVVFEMRTTTTLACVSFPLAANAFLLLLLLAVFLASFPSQRTTLFVVAVVFERTTTTVTWAAFLLVLLLLAVRLASFPCQRTTLFVVVVFERRRRTTMTTLACVVPFGC
jgi:hypothetical protein